jgi:hypothetical protein
MIAKEVFKAVSDFSKYQGIESKPQLETALTETILNWKANLDLKFW